MPLHRAAFVLIVLVSCEPKDDDTPVEPAETGETGDSSPDTQDTGTGYTPEDVPLGGACESAVHWGNFTVDSNSDYAYVSGTVQDGVVPITVHTLISTSGDCSLLRRENPFCDPPCEAGYTCSLDEECVPYPVSQDLGTVGVEGLVEEVSMEPVTPGYTYFDTTVPNPPWTPGTLVTLRTGGGAFAPVTLHGVAPADLVPTTLDWLVKDDEPLALNWDAPAADVRTRVRVTLNVDQHGTTPATIECWFADTGSAVIPADIVSGLVDMGLSGFPNASMTRLTADQAAVGEGCMDFFLTSSEVPAVAVSGYTPCKNDRDCPEGMDCNEEMERCE